MKYVIATVAIEVYASLSDTLLRLYKYPAHLPMIHELLRRLDGESDEPDQAADSTTRVHCETVG